MRDIRLLMEFIENLYRQYYDRVLAFLVRLSGDVLLAEELTQETFFQAFISIGRFRGDSEVYTWLISIARHVFFKYVRRKRLDASTAVDPILESWRADETLPEAVTEREDLREKVRGVIASLPTKYRDVVIMRIYAGLPFAEIASSLGITENSAKVIYFRAKKKLAEELKHELEL